MKRFFYAISVIAAIAMASAGSASACTGITLRTADGNVVMARTIEWSGSDMYSCYVVVPRGHVWKSMTPDGRLGCEFKARYGYVGLGVEQSEFVTEGINECGLSAGLFYFPDYGEYESLKEENLGSSVSDLQLVSYILSTCANVDDVRAALEQIHVFGIDPRASTVHWRFAEPSGRQIVLEIIDGKCVFYDNELGVLTNSPSFDWQLTNLNNYVNLIPGKVAKGSIEKMDLRSFGGGSGLLGLPGDVTPPSRFVRAAFYQCSAPVLDSAEKTVAQAFHILNNFDIPIGSQYAPGETPAPIPSATHWTVASDLSGKKIYYRTMHNCQIRCIDLSKIDFSKVKFTTGALDPIKEEVIHYLTF